jgi:hypothetical protein
MKLLRSVRPYLADYLYPHAQMLQRLSAHYRAFKKHTHMKDIKDKQWGDYLKDRQFIGAELLNRKEALDAFLMNPEHACEHFPELREDLVTFFALCTNPHVNDNGTEKTAGGKKAGEWERAQIWAQEQINAEGQ